jgi:hypothetical protein
VDNNIPPVPPVALVPPEEPKSNVIQLRPKKVVEEQRNLTQLRDVFMRRQKCLFENTFAGGCKCGYCVFMNMMSQRVFEMIKNEFLYQGKKGTMVFTTQDMIDILQGTVERVISSEREQRPPPPPPEKK